MNTRNRITLLLAAIMVVALLVVGMTLTASAADGDLVTEYGTVPAANANDNFAIFHKAEGAKEYTFVKSLADPFKDSVWAEYQTTTGEFVVIQLNDCTVTSNDTVGYFTNFVTMKAAITFDLNSKVLNANVTNDKGLFWIKPAAVTEDTVSNVLVKDGTILVNSDNIVLGGNLDLTADHDITVNLTFSNVRFDQVDGKTSDQPIVQPAKGTTNMVTHILFDECVFDFTGKAAGATFFHAGNRNGYYHVNTVIRGGETIIDATCCTTDVRLSLDVVEYENGVNGPHKLTMPAGYTISNITLSHGTNNTAYNLISNDENGVCYAITDLTTEYGAIPNGYRDVDRYPFVIFTKATGADTWTFHTTQADASQDMSVATNKVFDPWADNVLTTWWMFDGDVAILQRRDVDLTTRINCSNCIRPNVNLIIDMAGYTMIGSEAANGTFFFATKATTNYGGGNGADHRYWTFKNGTIVTKSSAFIVFGHNVKITDNPTVNLNFDNVTFDRADGATKEQPFVQFNSVTDSAFTANVTYNDCTFDIRGELPSSKLYLFTVCNNVNSLITANIVVNGGKIVADDTDPLQLYLLGSKCLGSFAMNEGSDGELLQLILPAGTQNNFIKGGDNTANLVNIPGHPYAYSYGKTSSDGVNDTYKLVPYWMTTSQAIPKTSVTLTTDLIYNIYIPTARVTAAKINGEVINLPPLPQVTLDNGLTYWHYTVEAGLLGAGDEIELITTVNTGGTTRMDATRRISVVKYAKTVLANNPTETNATLVKDMLAYVKAACVYANDKAETVAAINAIIGEDYAVAPSVGEVVESTEGLASVQLLLGDKPAFVFTPNGEYDINAYKFSADGTSLKTEIAEIDDKQVIIVYAYAYAMTYTVNYTIEGTEVSGAYNLAAYLAHEKAAGHANTVALVEALWQYSVAAKAYKVANA